MQGLNRRAFLAASTAAVILPALPAFAQTTTVKDPAMLDALVGEGKLPAVVDRLPLNPLVITPLDRVGTHGGDWSCPVAIAAPAR